MTVCVTLSTACPGWHHRGMDAHPDHLDTVIAATDRTIAAISDDQLSLATPCGDWDVRALLEHVITGNRAFAAALRPDAAVAAAPVSGSASGLLESYRDSAAQVTAGFRLEGALTRMVTVPFGTVPGAVALHLPVRCARARLGPCAGERSDLRLRT